MASDIDRNTHQALGLVYKAVNVPPGVWKMRIREAVVDREKKVVPFPCSLALLMLLACVGCRRDGPANAGKRPEPIAISIGDAQQITVDSVGVGHDELGRILLERLRQEGNSVTILVRVDEVLPFGDLGDVLGVIETAGFYRLLFPAVRGEERLLLALELAGLEDRSDRILIRILGREPRDQDMVRHSGKYNLRCIYGTRHPDVEKGGVDEIVAYQQVQERLAVVASRAIGGEVHVYIYADPGALVEDFLDAVYAVDRAGLGNAFWQRSDYVDPVGSKDPVR